MSPDTIYHTDWWGVGYFIILHVLAVYGLVQITVKFITRWFDNTFNYHIEEDKWIRDSAERIRKARYKKHG